MVAVLAACGSGRGAGYTVDVGADDAGPGSFGPIGEAGSAAHLAAHVEQNHMTVTFVTLTCADRCADVEAVATGGNPPYTFAWDDGSKGAAKHVCPTSTTSYAVTVTDSATTGELARPAQTVQVPLTADVIACPDGGAADSGTSACDSISDVSPAGANPDGPWSYGWSQTLGGTFTVHSEYLTAPRSNQIVFTGMVAWTSGVNGIEINPATYFNPSYSPDLLYTSGDAAPPWVIGARQVIVHPGPASQYSVVRWTARTAGAYVVHATFGGAALLPALTTTDVHVQHTGTDLAGGTGSLNVNGGTSSFAAAIPVTVAAGDTIDFAVGDGGNTYLSDSTSLLASVCREP
ncbi:MAG: hypothetical protein ACRENE_00180 [Polyangiaceae bacterium]